MMKMIEVQQIQKNYFAKEVLKNLTFEVRQGEFYGLLGANGAGKSTTIDCILGLQKIDQGSIYLLGQKNGKKQSKSRFEKIGVQFQQAHYADKITVAEVCTVTSSYYKNPESWKKLLKDFGLVGKEKQKVTHLSGGEQQKLSVLLTLIPKPKVVFLDELTTGLDTIARRQVWQLLKKLKTQGLTILLTSHYMDEVEALCDRIGIIVNGEIMVEGTVAEVKTQSKKETLEDAYLWYTGEVEKYEGI